MERHFHGLKLQWGFDQFISLKASNDASNGYLVEDTYVLGTEVFVIEGRRERGVLINDQRLPHY